MPSVLENRNTWTHYNWDHRGEQWSSPWGSSENIWFGTLLPRLHEHLPAKRILEIAPGFGRMTQHIVKWCDDYVGIDVTPRCVEHCRVRFDRIPYARFSVNDGTSLDVVENGSVDFVFSWDSLVHAECEVLEAYLLELGRKLKPGGAGFFHHSNIGAYRQTDGSLSVPNPHWRGSTMTAKRFREYCTAAGLRCVTQEIVSWGQEELNDCFSYFIRDAKPCDVATNVVERPDFFQTEVARLSQVRSLYSSHIAPEPVPLPMDWRLNARTLRDLVLTCQRESVATATLAGTPVRLMDAEIGTDPILLARSDTPGMILKATPHAIVVQTGDGTLVLRTFGYAGEVLPASQLVRRFGADRLA